MQLNTNAINDMSHEFLFSKFQENSEIKEAALIASNHRLAVPGWSFFPVFRAVIEGRTKEYQVKVISLAYDNASSLPVGVGMGFTAWGSFNFGCFVRKDFRRMGIGTHLIEKLSIDEWDSIRIHRGVEGSEKFWKSLGANEYGYLKE